MNNRVLFFSSVKDQALFLSQRFYVNDKKILEDIGFNVETTNKVSHFLKWRKYDIAFIYFYKWGFFCALIARLLGKKVYFTGGIDELDEDYTSSKKYFLQKLFFKMCCKLATRCILVSTADQKNVKKIYKGVLPSKLSFSFHSLNLNEFINDSEMMKENIFTTISWMENKENPIRKGIDKSLLVFSYLVHNYKDFEDYVFYIIGKEGKGSDYLKSICKDLDIENNVRFVGMISEVEKIKLLKRSKIYMQLSIYEGFGIAASEALATKNIVIHSGKGGLKDSVGNHGIILDIENDLIKQIPNLYRDIKNVDDVSLEKGKEYIFQNFAYEKRKQDFFNIIKI